MDEHDHHMSKAEAIGILCHLAMRKDLTIDEVIAIQTACRSTLKRLFDKERWHKRHNAADQSANAEEAVYKTPAEVLETVAGERPLDAILQNPPIPPQESEEDSE